MNIELMLRVRDQIAAHPEHFDMQQWWLGAGPTIYDMVDNVRRMECGTAACIAGWAIALDAKSRDYGWRQTDEVGAELLELTPEQTANIFFQQSWPDEYRIPFKKSFGAIEKANIAVSYINHLIGEEFIPEVPR